jgi:hypothetical protein
MPLVKISTGGTGKKAIVIDGGKLFLKGYFKFKIITDDHLIYFPRHSRS